MSQIALRSLDHSLAQLKLSSPPIVFSQVSGKVPWLQCVRCYRPRKPFWLPMAKSKMFRIPKKPQIPEEERVELARLYNVYRTNMKSLRLHFKEQLMAQTTGPEVIEERKQREAEQHAECIKINELWNIEVAKVREERLAEEAIERKKRVQEKIMQHEKEENELLEQIDSHIRSEKKAAESFITEKNIDEAIEVALANVVDHNFCIDLEGNVYKGRYGKPPKSWKPTQGFQSPSLKSTEEQTKTSVEARN